MRYHLVQPHSVFTTLSDIGDRALHCETMSYLIEAQGFEICHGSSCVWWFVSFALFMWMCRELRHHDLLCGKHSTAPTNSRVTQPYR